MSIANNVKVAPLQVQRVKLELHGTGIGETYAVTVEDLEEKLSFCHPQARFVLKVRILPISVRLPTRTLSFPRPFWFKSLY